VLGWISTLSRWISVLTGGEPEVNTREIAPPEGQEAEQRTRLSRVKHVDLEHRDGVRSCNVRVSCPVSVNFMKSMRTDRSLPELQERRERMRTCSVLSRIKVTRLVNTQLLCEMLELS